MVVTITFKQFDLQMEKNVDDKRGEHKSNIALQRMLICSVQSNLDYPDLDYPDYLIIRTFSQVPIFS